MSSLERQPIVLSDKQKETLESAKELHQRGLYYCPRDIGEHSTARALLNAGLLFRKDGVRHEETGNEVRGYGVVGLSYPDEAPISERCVR
jgi:hypothetical protein